LTGALHPPYRTSASVTPLQSWLSQVAPSGRRGRSTGDRRWLGTIRAGCCLRSLARPHGSTAGIPSRRSGTSSRPSLDDDGSQRQWVRTWSSSSTRTIRSTWSTHPAPEAAPMFASAQCDGRLARRRPLI